MSNTNYFLRCYKLATKAYRFKISIARREDFLKWEGSISFHKKFKVTSLFDAVLSFSRHLKF